MADSTPNPPQQGFFLAFVPRYDVVGTLHMFTLYLINQLPEDVHYDFDLEMKKEWAEGFEGHVSAGDSIVITDLDFMELDRQPVINLKCRVRWQVPDPLSVKVWPAMKSASAGVVTGSCRPAQSRAARCCNPARRGRSSQ